ncbi:HNH endonuclease signature motif containing protein [Nocardioides gilvus]|uniref:HNH endonuclease signature motif containing protein n=1 Tax=Nocardioides gilvus TaxID=1735589 RepID=UPI000D74ACDA|nr:HNH endonuclease signature motif containing protein [Nocardioides gilvus]
MLEATTIPAPAAAAPPAGASARDLLDAVRAEQVAAQRAEANVLACAYEWAVMHPSADGTQNADDAAVFFHPAGEEPISGAGCPGVAEFSVAEFGTTLGLSTTAAKKMIGHALELAHRLPRIWSRVRSGEVPAWRARLVAEATIHASPSLTGDAAAWIDAQVAPFLTKVGQAQIERTVEQAKKLFDLAATPEPNPEDPYDGLDQDNRHVHINHRQLNPDGTVDITGSLELVDALDLDHAVRCGAEELKRLGSTDSLGGRRAKALGHIGRHQLALDLMGARGTAPAADEGRAALGEFDRRLAGTAARRLDLHLHFDAMFSPDTGLCVSPAGRLEGGQRLLLLEQVKAWMGDSHTEVRILPVIDLNTEIECETYRPSRRLERQVELRDQTCVFPWCTRPAARCDTDHVEPYDHSARAEGRDQPGPTSTSNLGALCRSHHRLKTHTAWQVTSPANGVFVWTSPHGHRYRRDRHGTEPLPPEPRPPEPRSASD